MKGELNEYERARKIAEHLLSVAKHSSDNSDKDFSEWIENNPSAYEFMQNLTDSDKMERFLEKDAGYAPLASADKLVRKMKRFVIIRRLYQSVAVAVVVAVVVCGWLFFRPVDTKHFPYLASEPCLVLANGEVILLDTVQQFENSDTRIIKVKDREFVQKGKADTRSLDTSINRLMIPAQTQYTVQLPDGSRVRLNANTTLYYPTNFTSGERRVKISGEAYFDIVKDSVPFVVSASGADIRVYGTKFNINNYQSDHIETVLIEGSVAVVIDNGEKLRMFPDMKAVVEFPSRNVVHEIVDPSKYIAWLEGYFLFDGDSLEQVLQRLSKWYGVNFDCSESVGKSISVVARYSQKTPLSEILESLSITTHVTFVNVNGKYIMKQMQ